jgi:hypothetical protein
LLITGGFGRVICLPGAGSIAFGSCFFINRTPMTRHITVFSRLVTCAGRACQAANAERDYATNHQGLRNFFKREIFHDNSSIYFPFQGLKPPALAGQL